MQFIKKKVVEIILPIYSTSKTTNCIKKCIFKILLQARRLVSRFIAKAYSGPDYALTKRLEPSHFSRNVILNK